MLSELQIHISLFVIKMILNNHSALCLSFTSLKCHFDSSKLNTQSYIKYLFNFFPHIFFLFYSPHSPLYCSTLSEMLSGAF